MRSRTSGVPSVACAPQVKSNKVSLSNASIIEGRRLDTGSLTTLNQGFKAQIASNPTPVFQGTLRRRAPSMVLTLLLAVFVSGAALAASAQPSRPPPVRSVPRAAAAGTDFEYVLIILMENHNICDILTSCGGSAVYMSNLANAWGLAQDDHYCNVNPSLPNYLCLTGEIGRAHV